MPPHDEHSWGTSVDLSKKYESSAPASEPVSHVNPQYLPGKSLITSFVIRHGGRFIKDEGQVYYVLLTFIALMVAVSFFVLFNTTSRTTSRYEPVPITGREFDEVNWPPSR